MTEQIQGFSRHSDPITSREAGESFDASRLMAAIYRVMSFYGEDGCISDDVERHLPGVLSHSITPRFRQMLDRGMIEYTGERRVANSGRTQAVRRVLPPPFQPSFRYPLVNARAIAMEMISAIRATAEVLPNPTPNELLALADKYERKLNGETE
jgi:hypothetical protein